MQEGCFDFPVRFRLYSVLVPLQGDCANMSDCAEYISNDVMKMFSLVLIYTLFNSQNRNFPKFVFSTRHHIHILIPAVSQKIMIEIAFITTFTHLQNRPSH